VQLMTSANGQHPSLSGDLLGNSVEVMRGECDAGEVGAELISGLALEQSTAAAAVRPRPPPRRSSRIAEKKIPRVIR